VTPAELPCPACGRPNPAPAAFCHRCGHQLADLAGPRSALLGTRPQRLTGTGGGDSEARPGQDRPSVATGACPACGTSNPPGARFCHRCGSELSTSRAGKPGETVCATCGGLNPFASRFCHHCGGAMAGDQPVRSRVPPDPENRPQRQGRGDPEPPGRVQPARSVPPRPLLRPDLGASGRRGTRRRRVVAVAAWAVLTAGGTTVALLAGVGTQAAPPRIDVPSLPQGARP